MHVRCDSQYKTCQDSRLILFVRIGLFYPCFISCVHVCEHDYSQSSQAPYTAPGGNIVGEHTRTHSHTHTDTQTHTHTFTHTHTHAHTHTHTHIFDRCVTCQIVPLPRIVPRKETFWEVKTSLAGPFHHLDRTPGDARSGRNVPHRTFEPRSEASPMPWRRPCTKDQNVPCLETSVST